MAVPTSLDAWVRVLTLLPIFACSVVGLAITLAKWVQLRRSGEHTLGQARALMGEREYGRAVAVARADRSAVARLIQETLELADGSGGRLANRVDRAGRRLAGELDYGLGGLALIATLGPLLGLFGTVVGIVVVFDRLAGAEGLVSAQQLAGGIGTALYTTVAGLIVGMLALVSHRWLTSRADRAIAELEAAGETLVELLEGAGS
jgi:biopolymer transport protein ExbB